MERAQKVDLESGMVCYVRKRKSGDIEDQKSTKSAESSKILAFLWIFDPLYLQISSSMQWIHSFREIITSKIRLFNGPPFDM